MNGDPRTPEEMRALAGAKEARAAAFHARADDAGNRLMALLLAKPDPTTCPTCGHAAADQDYDQQIAAVRFEERRFAGLGNAAATLATFWRGQADRLEAAMKERAS